MKAKVLKGINALMVFVLGLLGFGGVVSCMYGVPEYHGNLNVSGTISDQDEAPVKGANIKVKERGYISLEARSLADGKYATSGEVYPTDSVDIIVEDTTGVYEKDSVRVGVEFVRECGNETDSKYVGEAHIKQDYKLKKK